MRKIFQNLCVSTVCAGVLLTFYLTALPAGETVSEVPALTQTDYSFPSDSDNVRYLLPSFTVTGYSGSVSKGETAYINISSEYRNEISISVFYASGKSTSSVFVPKTPDDNGNVSWSWKIPASTSYEKIRVVLRSDTGYAELYIQIV